MPANGSSVAASVRAELARAGISGRRLAKLMNWDSYSPMARRLAGDVDFRAEELRAIAGHLGSPASRFHEDAEREATAEPAQSA